MWVPEGEISQLCPLPLGPCSLRTPGLSIGLHCVSHLAQKKRKKDRKKQRPAGTPEEPPAAPGQCIDRSYLCCEHHKAMIAGLALLRNPELLLGEGVSLPPTVRACERAE